METSTAVRNIKKRNDGSAKIDSAVYLRQRKMANARKRKFLERMTPEQREIKRAKDREYHKKKKREMRLKKIADLTEQEKEKKRISWKKASQKYREAKRNSSEIKSNTQSQPKDESAPKKVRRHGRRKIVGRESYNEIEELEKRINQKKQELKYLKEQAQAREAKKKPAPTIPDSEVDDSFKDIRVPSQIQQNHQIVEFLNTKVRVKADALLRSYKTGEVFEICNIEFTTNEQSMLYMAINILHKKKNSNIMILNSDVKLHETMNFYEQDNATETRTFKINCLRKIIC